MLVHRLTQWATSNPVKLFVIGTTVFGFFAVIVIPPFQPPDEGSHLVRAYELSELKISQPYHVGTTNYLGNYLPKSIRDTYEITKLYRHAHTPDVPQAKKYSYHQTIRAFHIPLDKSRTEFTETGTSPQYIPTSYIPQAILIRLLSIVHAPVIIMLYSLRLLCLSIWIVFGIISIRLLKNKSAKLPLASILLLPMFITQASIPGTDALLTGATLLFLVIVFNAYTGKQVISGRRYLLLTLLLLIMTFAKPVYVVFGILLLGIAARRRGWAAFLLKVAPAVGAASLYVGWSLLTRHHGAPAYITSIDSVHANPAAQIHYLIPNLFRFIEPLVNTVFLSWGDGIYASLIGVFGQLDTPLPLLFVLIGFLLIMTAMLTKSDTDTADDGLSSVQKYLLALVAIVYGGAIYLSMYVISTPPTVPIIIGVQGRYFLPTVVLLALFVPKIIRVRQKLLVNIYCLVPTILLTIASLVILLRYYAQYP